MGNWRRIIGLTHPQILTRFVFRKISKEPPSPETRRIIAAQIRKEKGEYRLKNNQIERFGSLVALENICERRL